MQALETFNWDTQLAVDKIVSAHEAQPFHVLNRFDWEATLKLSGRPHGKCSACEIRQGQHRSK